MAFNSSQYKYTVNDVHITDDQRRFYEQNGYLIVPKLIEDEILDECTQRFVDICNKTQPPQGNMILMKDLGLRNRQQVGEYLYYKINDFLYDDVFIKYASYKKLVDIVSSIIGPDITATHSMYINKPPGADEDDSRHPLHQDMFYFPFGPPEKVVAAWTALQSINKQNGGLFAIPGSHKEPIYPHIYPENVRNKSFLGVHGFDHVPKVDFVMDKGDTVFFHPHLLHGSGPNLTKGFRRALTIHFADTNCNFSDMAPFQENVVNEIVAIFASKGVRLPYQDIWKYKGRLIRGRPGNFQKYISRL